MWFKVDSDLIHRSRPFYRCSQLHYHGDRSQFLRFKILFEILASSADNSVWINESHLSKDLHQPLKCCEQVWKICIEEKVLRPIKDGFNASEWMREIGILGNSLSDKKRRQSKPINKDEPAKNDFMSIDITSPFRT